MAEIKNIVINDTGDGDPSEPSLEHNEIFRFKLHGPRGTKKIPLSKIPPPWQESARETLRQKGIVVPPDAFRPEESKPSAVAMSQPARPATITPAISTPNIAAPTSGELTPISRPPSPMTSDAEMPPVASLPSLRQGNSDSGVSGSIAKANKDLEKFAENIESVGDSAKSAAKSLGEASGRAKTSRGLVPQTGPEPQEPIIPPTPRRPAVSSPPSSIPPSAGGVGGMPPRPPRAPAMPSPDDDPLIPGSGGALPSPTPRRLPPPIPPKPNADDEGVRKPRGNPSKKLFQAQNVAMAAGIAMLPTLEQRQSRSGPIGDLAGKAEATGKALSLVGVAAGAAGVPLVALGGVATLAGKSVGAFANAANTAADKAFGIAGGTTSATINASMRSFMGDIQRSQMLDRNLTKFINVQSDLTESFADFKARLLNSLLDRFLPILEQMAEGTKRLLAVTEAFFENFPELAKQIWNRDWEQANATLRKIAGAVGKMAGEDDFNSGLGLLFSESDDFFDMGNESRFGVDGFLNLERG